MATYLTPNRHGYSVRFSPFTPDRLVVATSQFFGLAGGGTLFILDLTPDKLVESQTYQYSDGLFDVAWSKSSPHIAVTASGDGALQLWDITSSSSPHIFREHSKEVYSVDSSQSHFLSASWDCSIKLWDPNSPHSLGTFLGHSQLVYGAVFATFAPHCFASVSGDGCLRLWSTLSPHSTGTFRVHDAEVLSCDWSKFDENLLVTSGSDGLIRGWDVRRGTQPLFQLKGGDYAVRRVQFSPHFRTVVASVGYDFLTKMWDFKKSEPLEVFRHHSEFVYGLDWNGFAEGQVADCGWDSLVHVFSPRGLKGCK